MLGMEPFKERISILNSGWLRSLLMDRAPGGSGMEERGALGRALAELGIEAMVGECRVQVKGRATGAGHRWSSSRQERHSSGGGARRVVMPQGHLRRCPSASHAPTYFIDKTTCIFL